MAKKPDTKPKAKKKAKAETTADDANKIEKKIEIRDLLCVLTQEEFDEAAAQMTDEMVKVQKIEQAQKIHAAKVKAHVAKRKAKVLRLRDLVHDRKEQRKVDCTALFDYTAGTVVVTRDDTGEVIEERDIKETERQMVMDFTPDPMDEDKDKGDGNDKSEEELINKAITIIANDRRATTSHIQRRLRIGYNRASLILEELEKRGIIGPIVGSSPRDILIRKEDSSKPDDDDAAGVPCVKCETCDGFGTVGEGHEDCEKCNGIGAIPKNGQPLEDSTDGK